MYECPNCGGNLQFDIAAGQMLCGYCGTTADPYSLQKEDEVLESGEYEATVFTCSQCGAELLSEDTTAATFCSFCGSSAVLESRIGRGRRPAHIIPFSRTREDCKASYARMMRRAFFAPKELKDQAYIEKFRGIYMPYWVYSFEKKGKISFRGSRSSQKGDYLVTKHYDIVSEVDASYQGISFDAAAAFSDELSGAIAPYQMETGKPFTPSFLSGFYADASDVDSSVYRQDACDLVTEEGFGRISGNSICARYHVKAEGNRDTLKNALRPSCTSAELAMFPVWFLTYRKGDRVAYAVVNGQTGKAAADLPVDRKKYLACSLLLALPLFILLNLRFTITPGISLLLAAFLSFVCAVVSCFQASRIRERELLENDKGYMQSVRRCAQDERKRILGMSVGEIKLLQTVIGGALFMVFTPVAVSIAAVRSDSGLVILGVLLVCFALIRIVTLKRWQEPVRKGVAKEMLPVLAKPAAAILFAFVIMIWNPVSDLYYYGGAAVSMAAVIWSFLDIIERHNVLATRKLPQFNRRGGDENA